MALIRITIFAAALLLVSAVPPYRNADLYICHEPEAKKQVFDQTIQHDAAISGVELTVHIPENGVLDSELTCIIATDLKSDGSEVSLQSGGVGTYNAIIKLKSKWFNGLHYRIQAWVGESNNTSSR